MNEDYRKHILRYLQIKDEVFAGSYIDLVCSGGSGKVGHHVVPISMSGLSRKKDRRVWLCGRVGHIYAHYLLWQGFVDYKNKLWFSYQSMYKAYFKGLLRSGGLSAGELLLSLYEKERGIDG